MLGVLKH